MKDKIPYYDIVNMFFAGSVFSIIAFAMVISKHNLILLMSENLVLLHDWSVIVIAALLVLMFEVGFLLNRLGAVVLDPILVTLNIWPKKEYNISESKLKSENTIFRNMCIELNLTRTHIIIYVLLGIEACFLEIWIAAILFFFIIVLLVFAGRRRSEYINKVKSEYLKSTNGLQEDNITIKF